MSVRNEILENILAAIQSGSSVTPSQLQAINDYIATDYIRMINLSQQNVTSTTATIDLGTVSSSFGIVYDPVDFSFNVTTSRLYSLNITINGSSAGNNSLYAWFESYSGGAWNIIPSSGVELTFANNQAKQAAVTSTLIYPQGLELRFRAKTSSGTVVLGSSFIEDVTTITVPSITLAVVAEAPQ